jgi:hypothetical protein
VCFLDLPGISSLFSVFVVVSGGARCAKHVFQTMVGSVLRAPMSYFETTPLGRILNRFTYDIEVVDLTLTESMSVLMISCSWFVAGVTIQIVILPWIALALFPVVVAYSALLLRYRKSGPDLQRIDALTRSPIQAMLSEGNLICLSRLKSSVIFYHNVCANPIFPLLWTTKALTVLRPFEFMDANMCFLANFTYLSTRIALRS